jgi:hypothetical protein
MTPLCLDAPLASLLDVCRAAGVVTTQEKLGERRKPPVDQAVVARTISRGDRIELATLAAYARAAGYRLLIGTSGGASSARALQFLGSPSATVEQARALLASLGLEMTLAVESAEGSGG